MMPSMGVFRRLRRGQPVHAAPASAQRKPAEFILLGGSEDLEVVGESYYQDALWQVIGGRTTDRVRVEIQAVLFPEVDNSFDANAISVWIKHKKVGHLSREDAAAYRPGLVALQDRHRHLIGLNGVVVGGGMRADGPGNLGVWLSHNPSDFGLTPVAPPLPSRVADRLRTGLSEALTTDEVDDSYDLSWLAALRSDHVSAIRTLRQLLKHDPDLIDRHFMFCELERRLYRSRDAFASALSEYDDACRQHDSEMDGIRVALLAKFGKVPLLETYTQMTIRQQKAKSWAEAIRWASRGVELYGNDAARVEAVEDLRSRLAACRQKLETRNSTSHVAPQIGASPAVSASGDGDTGVCDLRRGLRADVTRGRKPRQCPTCRLAR
jgi:hypothetical protein